MNKIREKFKECNVTISEFSRAEGVPIRTLQNWCRGERKPPEYLERWTLEKIEQYAKEKAAE